MPDPREDRRGRGPCRGDRGGRVARRVRPVGRRSRRSPEAVAQRRAARAAIDDVGKVVEYAAWLLESRSRSVAEVRRKLIAAGFRTALIDDAIARLEELGFLDDEVFASAWVQFGIRARPRGEHALRRELALEGVDRGVIDGVLAARRGEVDEPDDPFVAPVEGDPDRAAAERLLERRRSALLREPESAQATRQGVRPPRPERVRARRRERAVAPGRRSGRGRHLGRVTGPTRTPRPARMRCDRCERRDPRDPYELRDPRRPCEPATGARGGTRVTRASQRPVRAPGPA